MGLRPVTCLLVLFVAAAPGMSACRGSSDVSFEIAVPSGVVADVEWFEIGAFEGASCAALTPMLGAGIPEGSSRRVAFRKNGETPSIGELARGTYAFGAVARGADCAILAAGCEEADVGDASEVVVRMSETDKSGACSIGASCQSARCVPNNDNGDPAIGANCSLELLGAGPLLNSLGGPGTLTSAPAVSATPNGFLIAYREVDPNGGGARVTLLPIDPSGGALMPARPALPNRCDNSQEFDGVGLVVRGTTGMLAFAKDPCGVTATLELLNFAVNEQNVVEVGKYFVSTGTNRRIFLSPGGVVGVRGIDTDALAFVDGDGAFVTTMHPTPPTDGGVGRPTGSFGGTTGITGAWAAASDRVLALLASGTGNVTADAGATDAGAESTLRLVMSDVSTVLDQFSAATNQPRAPIVFPGEWGALAARGTRVIVLSDGSGPGRSVTFRTFDLGGLAPLETGGFAIEGGGKVTTGAVAIQGDRAYFAALKQGAVALSVWNNASTVPAPLRNVLFSREPRIPSVASVRDGRVAVAATDSRVIVAWTNAKVLGPNDFTGAYAVFACSQ